MYVSYDSEKMRFLHKHENINILANLDFIEHPTGHICICPIDSTGWLNEETETELQLLYKNTTGLDHSQHHGAQLREVLRALAYKLPVDDVNGFEADRQADHVSRFPNKEGYVFVPGATIPKLRVDAQLFATVTLSADEAVNAARKRIAPAHTPAVTVPATSAPPRTPNAVSAPRAGGVRTIIWMVADELWEAAGRPSDKQRVLGLRKEAMDRLEKVHNIKRTSSSNELGNWQKARI